MKRSVQKGFAKQAEPKIQMVSSETPSPAFLPVFKGGPVAKDANIDMDRLTVDELIGEVTKNAAIFEKMKNNPDFLQSLSGEILLKLGKKNNDFASFLFNNLALRNKIQPLTSEMRFFGGLGAARGLIENNPELAKQIFNDPKLLATLIERDMIALCAASEEIVTKVVDIKNPDLFRRISPLSGSNTAAAIYKHEAFSLKIVTDQEYQDFIGGSGFTGFEMLAQKGTVASKILEIYTKNGSRLSGSISSNALAIISGTSLDNFKLVLGYLDEVKDSTKHIYFDNRPKFTFTSEQYAQIGAMSLEHAKFIWSNDKIMATFKTPADKVRLAKHHPEFAFELLENSEFCKKATSYELECLGSIHRNVAERVYSMQALRRKLTPSSHASLGAKYDFFAKEIFDNEKLLAEISVRDLALMGKSLLGNGKKILDTPNLRSKLDQKDVAEIESNIKMATALQNFAKQPTTEVNNSKEVEKKRVEVKVEEKEPVKSKASRKR